MKSATKLNETLYENVANKEYEKLFNALNTKKVLSDYEKSMYCLAFIFQGKVSEYTKWRGAIDWENVTGEAKVVLLEAELLDSLRLQKPKAELEAQVSEILQRRKNAIFAWSTLGQLKFIEKNVEEAIEIFKLIKSEYPGAEWVNQLAAYHLILTKNYEEAESFIRDIQNCTQRIFYSISADFTPTLRKLAFGTLAIVMMIVPQNINFWITSIVYLLVAPMFIYFVRVKDRYIIGLLKTALFATTVLYFVTRYIHF